VSPYKDQRDKFKSKMGDNLIEVYVHTTEVRGREEYFVKEYEKPSGKFIDIDTTNVSINDSANMILEFIKTN
jgi:adenylylsulfate kinase